MNELDIPFTTVRLEIQRIVKLTSLKNLSETLGELGLNNAAQEQLWILAIDSLNQIRSVTPVAIGTYHECYVGVPNVISPVLLSATDRFIMAHNHPNGRPNPTADDIDLTKRIRVAAEAMDLAFDDHVIVTPTGGWTSMKALGHL
jgi:DNA repair protein RadC